MHLSLNTFADAVTLVEGTSSSYSSVLSNLLADSYTETHSINEVVLNLVSLLLSGDVVCETRNFRLLRRHQYSEDAT